MRALLPALLLFALPLASARAQEPARLDYPRLLDRMVDCDWLWQRPRAGERCVQFSSYERRSDRGPGNPDDWYANYDRGHYLRVVERNEKHEHVMVDVDGPGCLSRLWSANPHGQLHFDVDGERVWSVDFAELCSGGLAGVPEPLAGMRSRGGNVYLPIPFDGHLTVSAEADDLYYLADVVRFPAEQRVASFAPALLTEHAGRILSLARAFPTASGPDNRELFVPMGKWRVEPGQLVRRVRMQLGGGLQPDEQHEVLQQVLLVVRCGEEETVRVPVTDFFAAGPQWRDHEGRFLSVRGRVGCCAYPMPMPEGGSIELVSDAPLDAMPQILAVDVEPLDIARPLLFRASYHLVKAQPTRPFSDHLVLDAVGVGRFVGCSLLVRNPSRIWWGEGDEKFFVDGEAFPSWFGTGTEDYFGYAWCDPTPFTAPFHAQVQCDGPMNFGFTQLHRSHVLDSVPFQRSFRFELERWHWIEDTTIDCATVAYWYGEPGAASGLPRVPETADRLLEALTQPPMFVAADALEGETLRVVTCSAGTHEVQDLGVFERTFSRDAHRWWRDGRPGDALVLAVPVAGAGRYRVSVAMTKADDFGIVQLSLGGRRLGQPFDGYAERVTTSGPFVAGTVELPAGDAELRLELVGKNERAKPRHMVGLDYLVLEKVE